MNLTRRALLIAAGASPVIAKTVAKPAASADAATLLPAKHDFAPMPLTFLDSGSSHPMSLAAKAALEEYLRSRSYEAGPATYNIDAKTDAVIKAFAVLVGADPDEICLVQSTTMGENLVIRALGIPESGGRIVTDALHFFGSFYMYGELGKAGMDVVTLGMTKDGRIDMAEMGAAVTSRTKLVSVSLVSTVNGFEHNLKSVCDIAHAHGAYVYADIIQAAGAVPVNLHASGVDFAATASYKWLMGDFGLGFLYVRKDVQDKVRRPWWGYEQLASFTTHVFPHDDPGSTVADYSPSPNAKGRFAMGTTAWTSIASLDYSLTWLNQVGARTIQVWRQPMVDAVQQELRRRGYEPLTPHDSKTQLVAFALKDARSKLADRMKAANVRITTRDNRFRVSVAVFNDMNDIDRLLDVLPRTPPA